MFGWMTVVALFTGRALSSRLGDRSNAFVTREGQPVYYWVSVAGTGLMTAFMVGAAFF